MALVMSPNHTVCLGRGNMVEAQNLKPGDSFLALGGEVTVTRVILEKDQVQIEYEGELPQDQAMQDSVEAMQHAERLADRD